MIRLERMNDTNKMILAVFQQDEALASSDVHEKLQGQMSLVTVKRVLGDLQEAGYLNREGAGRAVCYKLLSEGLAPVSYRSVDETAYKEALLVFYEQNSVVPFRELFVEQYEYSAAHYNIAETKS